MNLPLYEHISRLLFDHECVVVPGFGAFLTRYHRAEINQATHMMRPPSRRVYFNKSIKENDGLLAKAISLTENRPYDMALAYIANEVKEWKQTLVSGSKLRLTGVGRLYLDDARNLQFSPSIENNYLASSYGLAIFRTPAIEREAAIRKSIHQTIEKHIVTEPRIRTKEKTDRKRFNWAAVLGPVIFAGIVGAAYYTWQQNSFENLSGLNWFHFSRSTEQPLSEEELTAQPIKPVPLEEETPAPEVKEEKIMLPEEEAMKVESEAGAIISGFHIVVGSFRDEENAQSLINQLHDKGYTAYMAQGDRRFNRVAIGNFDTRGQAQNALEGVRQNLNPGAWVYAN